MPKKPSFFERLTGASSNEPLTEEQDGELLNEEAGERDELLGEEEAEEGELTVDVYQEPEEIVVKAMIAGVRPDDLEVSITRDQIIIRGSRQESQEISEDDYYYQELYWGSFSRTIPLPQEIEPEEAEASEKHGLLTIRLPKVDKDKKANLKVKFS